MLVQLQVCSWLALSVAAREGPAAGPPAAPAGSQAAWPYICAALKMATPMAKLAQDTAERLFLLDTRGWCVVEDALSPHDVQQLLAELSAAAGMDGTTTTGAAEELMVSQSTEDGTVRRWPFPYHWGPAFTALVDNPRITPLLHGRLGAAVKLDHEYVQTLHPNGSGAPVLSGGIHGGPRNHATGARGIAGSGGGELLTVVYELLDVYVCPALALPHTYLRHCQTRNDLIAPQHTDTRPCMGILNAQGGVRWWIWRGQWFAQGDDAAPNFAPCRSGHAHLP